ncbi:MAG TPA: GUN4 domain-containing protein [Nodosilinea sp.]|nr:GUN4 domain-containing protein [Nodosilinea sp.]
MAAVRSGLLFPPERNYLAEAETYSRSQGGLSPTELDNLSKLQQRLGLSVEEAELLNFKAAGPYPTQAEKHRHFEEITSAEFSRLRTMQEGPPFAPKEIWPVLQELAENLGLPTPEAEAIYQQYQQRYDNDLKLKTEQKAAKTAEDARLAAEANAEAERQQQAQQAQAGREQYRALCRLAMANGLYPSEYDQGRLEQTRRLQRLSTDDALKLEAEVRDELYGGVESAAGVDYSRLRHCLHQQAWQAADLETELAILTALNRDMQPVTAATVPRLPAVDLATIDALWSRYSKGHFGFKVQQQLYRGQPQMQPEESKRWITFQEQLGWRQEPTWLSRGLKPYHDLNFSLEAPAGHLPTWRWCCPSLNNSYNPSPEVMAAVMEHLTQALALETAGPAPEPALAPGAASVY